jgi:Na+-translocating ferredoxin:NAD+ oxidoreductase RnfA subunit
MVGCALGAQFSGVSRKLLVRGLGMGLLAGTYMLSLAAGFALILTQYLPTEFGVMFVSFRRWRLGRDEP